MLWTVGRWLVDTGTLNPVLPALLVFLGGPMKRRIPQALVLRHCKDPNLFATAFVRCVRVVAGRRFRPCAQALQ